MNIKNPRDERLAHQLARKTGETVTDAVIHALEDRVERLEGCRTSPDLVGKIMAIARCSRLPVLDSRVFEDWGVFSLNRSVMT